MGVKLRDLVHPGKLHLSELKGRRVALDAYNMLYQFLATIRQADGHPFTDAEGRVTSHLVGVLYRTASMLERGVLPVWVFDGKPSDLKSSTLRARAMVKEKAQRAWNEALAAGDLETARKKAAQTSRLTREMVADAQAVLSAMGTPWVQAPSEGEAQAAFMAEKGDVWAAASEDYDTLLFGAPRLLRGLGSARSASRGDDAEVEFLEVGKVTQELGISREELILIGVLIGTDFNEGVPGIGPKKAMKLVAEHQGWEATLQKAGVDPTGLDPVRDLFLHPATTEDYHLQWKAPDTAKVLELLVTGHGFGADRVQKVLDRLPKSAPSSGVQTSLEAFG
ncbi:MAG: flap endonuclease-1 [Euryarchaeota archaeon]|nr:flap endonuclease-1 [Euryarchaeota archaeon]MDE1835166.1 flap endonuclease-1 [Euryarchaeota archaeon]MDE1880423.1 flap endonuclease-1 [Euryarchaeota archaeon]MDE2045708.1 flap endonuclease-1 [Thermoplasmata archaeon]